MTQTGYAILKTHFDTIFQSAKLGTGYEHIRDTYHKAFGTQINRYSIHTSSLSVANNPISKITTFVGPKNDDLKKGIIPSIDTIHCVNVLDKQYLMGLSDYNIANYVEDVYMLMDNVMTADPLYNLSDSIIIDNPYLIFLRCCPLYFTYHHIAYVDPDMIPKCAQIFIDHLERKGICGSTEEAEKVLKSMASTKYSTTFEGIYSTLTCNNTVQLFC